MARRDLSRTLVVIGWGLMATTMLVAMGCPRPGQVAQSGQSGSTTSSPPTSERASSEAATPETASSHSARPGPAPHSEPHPPGGSSLSGSSDAGVSPQPSELPLAAPDVDTTKRGQASAPSSDAAPPVSSDPPTERPSELPDAESDAGDQPSPPVTTPDLTQEPNVTNSGTTIPPNRLRSGSDSGVADSADAGVSDAGTHASPPAETSQPASAADGETGPPREPLFEGWDKPDLVLVFSGRQHGYIEPCGCTGLANQKGGLVRRYSLLEDLKSRGWDVLAIDAGNQVRRFGRQAEIKFQTTMEGLRKMQYQAIALGPDDLRLPATVLAGFTVGTEGEASPFVSSNATIFGDPSFTPAYHVLEKAGKKIGVTSVVARSYRQLVNNDDIEFIEAEEGLNAAWQKLQAAQCDFYVLLVQGSLDESRELARKFPGFQLVVSAGGAGEPTLVPETVEGTRTQMIQVGIKGMYVGAVGLFGGDPVTLRYQRVPLDSRFADNRPMLDLLAAYQGTLKQLGLEGLEIRPRPHPSGNQFVGSQACADCHSEEYRIWEEGLDGAGGPHHHATESLVHPGERSEVPRHYDPECLSCHVTGWNPQQYFPYESGYLSLESTPLLQTNGCENCHGPGSRHVAAENGEIDADQQLLEKLRMQMRQPLDQAEQQCMTCHDLDNSPDFHVRGAFEKYWKQIEH